MKKVLLKRGFYKCFGELKDEASKNLILVGAVSVEEWSQ